MLRPTWFSRLASTVPAPLQSCWFSRLVPTIRRCSGPVRFSHLVPTVPPPRTHRALPPGIDPPSSAPVPPGSPLRSPPPLPSAAGDALRMRVWLFSHLCPCCVTRLHRDVAPSNGQAGCWKSPPPSADSWSSCEPVCQGVGSGATRLLPKPRRFGEADPTPCAREHHWGLGCHRNSETGDIVRGAAPRARSHHLYFLLSD